MKNNKHFKKFIEEIGSIKMTQNEKNKIRQNLEIFIDQKNLIISPYKKLFNYSRQILATSFIALIFIGSVSQLVSKDALPGQTLYGIKIAHEELKLVTSNNKIQKINYEIRRTEKRIQEAAELAQKEKLDILAQEEIVAVIQKQTKKVKDQIETVKKDDPKSALVLNTELKTTIKASSEILRKVTTPEIETSDPTELEKEYDIVGIIDISSTDTEALVKKTEILTGDSKEIDEDSNLDIPIITEEKDPKPESKSHDKTEILLEKKELSVLEIEQIVTEPDNNSLSSAQKLLDSLDNEIKEIEVTESPIRQVSATEKNTKEAVATNGLNESEEMVSLQKNKASINNPKDLDIAMEEIVDPGKEENKNKQEKSENDQMKEVLLFDIENTKKEISKIKLGINDSKGNDSEIYLMEDELELNTQFDTLIQKKEYENALHILQKIKSYYLEKLTENATAYPQDSDELD